MTGTPSPAIVLLLAAAAAGAGCSQRDQDRASATGNTATHASPAASAKTAQAPSQASATKTLLKPGLWRVEGPEFNALSEQGKVYLCIDAASTALIDPPTPAQAKCTTDHGSPKPGLYLGNSVCHFEDKVVTTRVRIDGDDLYFRDVAIQPLPNDGESGEKISHFAERVSDCQKDQTPGTAYTQAYGEDVMHPVELPESLQAHG